MISRRHFAATLLAGAAFPSAAFGQSVDAVRKSARSLGQLHALLIQRGNYVIVADAPRGHGLDRAANIKSCSKSVVGLLLGTAVTRGEISRVNMSLREIAPKLIPAKATPGADAITLEDLVTLRGGQTFL